MSGESDQHFSSSHVQFNTQFLFLCTLFCILFTSSLIEILTSMLKTILHGNPSVARSNRTILKMINGYILDPIFVTKFYVMYTNTKSSGQYLPLSISSSTLFDIYDSFVNIMDNF